jgi:bifunctional isochorismate lyase / aryl carrier protein
MTISPIASYEIPSKDSWPPSRAPWQLDAARAALLVHDMQAYFLAPFQAGSAPLEPLLGNVAALRKACAAAGVPVIFSAQPGDQTRGERGLLWDLWGPGIVSRPELSGLSEVCQPSRDDVMLPKRRYSAFHETDLRSLLRARGRDQLIICGVYAHIGCLATAIDGFMLGVQPFVVADATADFSLEDHRVALRQVARTCGVVTTTREVVRLAHERRIRAALEELLGPAAAALGPDDDFGDHGLDSLRAMQLFERVLPPSHGHDFEALIEARSLRALTQLLLPPEPGHELHR